MKKLFFLLMLLPMGVLAQTNNFITKPQDGFLIVGEIKGFPDSTSVALNDGQTGIAIAQSIIVGDKFTLSGKFPEPEFKTLIFNKQQPYISLFLDNSNITITGERDTLGNMTLNIGGSVAYQDYNMFDNAIKPYMYLFEANAPYDSAAIAKTVDLTISFATTKTTSYISPLALIRYNQLTKDGKKTEELFNKLAPEVQKTAMSNYVKRLISETKDESIGTLLPDFSQTDTSGKMLKLSSLRGKYVLIDFWASWCRPCRQENPNVVAAYNKFKHKSFTILGVSLDQSKEAWISAIKMDGLNWYNVSDLKGWSNAVAKQFNVSGIPYNILIDPQGKIVARNLRGTDLERILDSVLR